MLTELQREHLETLLRMKLPEPYKVIGEMAIRIHPMTYGKGRLCAGHVDELCAGHVDDMYGYEVGYCYATPEQAFAAADAWDGTGEPQGWMKNLQTGRYRKNGDPSKEYGPDDKEPD